MLEDKEKVKIDSLSIDELGKDLALQIYGPMNSAKASYAQYVLDVKKRNENQLLIETVISAINESGVKIAQFIDKLIIGLDRQVKEINNSNNKIANSQKWLIIWQVIAAFALVLATFGLIYVTGINK